MERKRIRGELIWVYCDTCRLYKNPNKTGEERDDCKICHGDLMDNDPNESIINKYVLPFRERGLTVEMWIKRKIYLECYAIYAKLRGKIEI